MCTVYILSCFPLASYLILCSNIVPHVAIMYGLRVIKFDFDFDLEDNTMKNEVVILE